MTPARKQVANSIIFAEVIQFINEGRSVKLSVKGNSMRPFIFQGDTITLEPISELRVGDIVLAQVRPNNFLVHRTISIEGKFITLRGDGNIGITEECMNHDIIAQVTMVERKKNGAKIDPRTPKQLRYSAIWQLLFPIRRYLLAIGKRMFGWEYASL